MEIQTRSYASLFLLFSFGLSAQIPSVSSGKIERIALFPSKWVTPRNVDVWLPENYSPKNKYAVLYMHDGQMLFDSAITWNHQEWRVDETMGLLLQSGQLRHCIVVAIWNVGQFRHSDYFPQKPFESLPDSAQQRILEINRNSNNPLFGAAVQSDNYLRFIVKELKPYIDGHFATKKGRKNTFIAGSSMGGLISMYAICEYPDVFGGVACLSTHWPGTFETKNNPVPDAFLTYLKAHLPDPKTHRFYFDYGTATLDALYEPYQLRADMILKEGGYTAQNWLTRKYEGEDHSEQAWAGRLQVPVLFLLGK